MQTNINNSTLAANNAPARGCYLRLSLHRPLVLALTLCASLPLLTPPTPALAQTKTSTNVSAKAKAARAAKEKHLRQRLNKAWALRDVAQQTIARYPVFNLNGTIEQGEGGDLRIYGKAHGNEFTSTRAIGWATEKKFLTVRNFARKDVYVDQLHGRYMAVSPSEYVPVPAAYDVAVSQWNNYTAIANSIEAEIAALHNAEKAQRQRIARAQEARIAAAAATRSAAEKQRRAKAAQTLIADFKTRFAKLEVANTPEAHLEYSASALALYRQQSLQNPGEVKLYEPLRDMAVVHNVKAATHLAAGGQLEAASDLLVRTLWPASIQPQEVSVAMSSVYSAQSFGAPAQAVFKRQPALLGQLLAAWSLGFPLYAKAAPYAEMVPLRKFGEVLARSASEYALPQNATLLAALQRLPVDDLGSIIDPAVTQLPNLPGTAQPIAKAALDFEFRQVQTRKKYRLSDFRGKVVVLLLGEFQNDDSAAGPSRIERFGEFSKEYDPAQVVFLCVIADLKPASYFQDLMDARTDPKRVESGARVRQYPDLYSLSATENAKELQTFDFYNGRADRYSGNRVTVIDAAGQVMGATDFIFDSDQTVANDFRDRKSATSTRQVSVCEFDRDALDAQIIEALAPAK